MELNGGLRLRRIWADADKGRESDWWVLFWTFNGWKKCYGMFSIFHNPLPSSSPFSFPISSLPFSPSLYLPSLSLRYRHLLTVQNIFNECEDSLLATPLIFDLAILAELLTRVKYRPIIADKKTEFEPLYSVLSLLSFMLKAPLVKPGTDVVNSLNRQRNGLEAFLKACLGLEGSGDLLLETRVWWSYHSLPISE